jgi:hypothetical protein
MGKPLNSCLFDVLAVRGMKKPVPGEDDILEERLMLPD